MNMQTVGHGVLAILLIGNILTTALSRPESVRVDGPVQVTGVTKVTRVNLVEQAGSVGVIQAAQKWEYGTEWAPDTTITQTFTGLGSLGWIAVWCRKAHDGKSPRTWGMECLFRRPKVGLVKKK